METFRTWPVQNIRDVMEVNSWNIPLYLAPLLAFSGNAKGTRKEVRVFYISLDGYIHDRNMIPSRRGAGKYKGNKSKRSRSRSRSRSVYFRALINAATNK